MDAGYEGDCFGENNFSDAPSLVSARSIQHTRNAIRKENISDRESRKCMPKQRGVMLDECTDPQRDGTRFLAGKWDRHVMT